MTENASSNMEDTRTSAAEVTDDEELCIAELKDYRAVVDIDPDVNSGMDRVPEHYSSYVQGAGVRGFIYKKRGRVVGFVSARVVDGGQTLCTTAGRLTKECRGVGMYGRFKRLLYQQYTGFPNLRLIVMSLDNANLAVNGQRVMKTYSQVMERGIKVMEADLHAFIIAQQLATPNPDLKQLSRDDVHAMMKRPKDQLRHLFPEGRLFLRPRYCPFQIIPENADMIIDDCSVFLVSGGASNIAGKSSDGGDLFPAALLSRGDYFRCKKGVCYNLDIFGEGDVNELRTHLEWHVKQVTHFASVCQVFLYVLFPVKLSEEVDAMKTRLPLRHVEFPFSRECVLQMEFLH